MGELTLSAPRDRDGTFGPQVIPKHQRRVPGFDEKILPLYAKGMTTRDIQEIVRSLETCPQPLRHSVRGAHARVNEPMTFPAGMTQKQFQAPILFPAGGRKCGLFSRSKNDALDVHYCFWVVCSMHYTRKVGCEQLR
jgi:hypothetical protein